MCAQVYVFKALPFFLLPVTSQTPEPPRLRKNHTVLATSHGKWSMTASFSSMLQVYYHLDHLLRTATLTGHWYGSPHVLVYMAPADSTLRSNFIGVFAQAGYLLVTSGTSDSGCVDGCGHTFNISTQPLKMQFILNCIITIATQCI